MDEYLMESSEVDGMIWVDEGKWWNRMGMSKRERFHEAVDARKDVNWYN